VSACGDLDKRSVFLIFFGTSIASKVSTCGDLDKRLEELRQRPQHTRR
jgi:hypothetical protein